MKTADFPRGEVRPWVSQIDGFEFDSGGIKPSVLPYPTTRPYAGRSTRLGVGHRGSGFRGRWGRRSHTCGMCWTFAAYHAGPSSKWASSPEGSIRTDLTFTRRDTPNEEVLVRGRCARHVASYTNQFGKSVLSTHPRRISSTAIYNFLKKNMLADSHTKEI